MWKCDVDSSGGRAPSSGGAVPLQGCWSPALQVACDLELWQEAFRSVEDLQGLLAMKRKPAKPQMMATYYAKLTKIFSVSGSRLYNGYAW